MVVAQVPGWVEDWGLYLGLIGAFFAVIAGIWAFTKVVTNGIVRGVDLVFDAKVPAIIEEKVPAMLDAALETKLVPIRDKQDHVVAQVEAINHAVNNVPPGSPTILQRVTDAQADAKAARELAETTAHTTTDTLHRIELNQVSHLLDRGVDPEKIVMPDASEK